MYHISAYTTLFSIMVAVLVASTASRTTYRAAIFEHTVILPAYTSVPVTRHTALQNMEKNLAVFRLQAAEAKRQGADILVLPEDGLYGTNFTRETVYPYLEFIPDPDITVSLPCSDPVLSPGSEVQRALSCMSKHNSLYLVADMGDKQPCDPSLGKMCPKDGHFQYNTAVAYGPDGRLLAKYHKFNLYKEYQFDYPQPEVKYFNTPFGRFGLLICFDLLFSEPLLPMLSKERVRNIAFPTAWMDSLPLLSAIGYHSSIARGLNVNLLTANLHLPEGRFQGSGIFTPEGMTAFYYNNTPHSSSRLLVADVKVIKEACSDPLTCHAASNKFAKYKKTYDSKDALISSMLDNHKHLVQVRDKTEVQELSKLFVKKFLQPPKRKLLVPTKPSFENLNFTFIPLTRNLSTAHVCRGQVCCHVTYTMLSDEDIQELLVLGAFDGVYHDKYYFQVCTVLKCPTLDKSTCGSFTFESWTRFTKLSLSGDFTTEYVFPQLIVSTAGQLALAQAKQWTFGNNTMTIKKAIDTPILLATLLGRLYQRDPKS